MGEETKDKESDSKVRSDCSSNRSSKGKGMEIENMSLVSSKNSGQNTFWNPSIPDDSTGDFYCKLCDSHMQTMEIWVSHISGRKHVKNVTTGLTELKYEDINQESIILKELKHVKDPIIGLNYITEIRRRYPGVNPIFQCYLCPACMPTTPLVIEHLISTKHRLNVLKAIVPDTHDLIISTHLKTGYIEYIIEEEAAKLQEKVGMGVIRVRQEKSKASDPRDWPPPYKRKRPIEENDHPAPQKTPKVTKFQQSCCQDHRPSYEANHRHDYHMDSNPMTNRYDPRCTTLKSVCVPKKKCYHKSCKKHHHTYRYDADDRKRSSSLRDGRDYSRRIYYKDFQDSEKYFADKHHSHPHYLRPPSHRSHSYDVSSKHNTIPKPKKLVMKHNFSPVEFLDARHYLDARSQIKHGTNTCIISSDMQQTDDSSSSCQLTLILKATARKLENLTFDDLTAKQLDILSKIISYGHNLLKQCNLLSESEAIQDDLAAKIGNMRRHSATVTSSGMYSPPAESDINQSTQDSQSDIADLNQLVCGARKALDSPCHLEDDPVPDAYALASDTSANCSPSPERSNSPSSKSEN